MKLKLQDNGFDTNSQGGMQMTINPEDQAMIASFLREKIYTDPKGAVVRELISNGWDSHVAAGTTDVPMKVTLKSSIDTVILKYFSAIGENFFQVRDYGTGMTPETVRDVFAKFGASNKRDSDNQIGGFGLGAKSPLGYATAFAMTSWVDGMKYDYFISDDADAMATVVPVNVSEDPGALNGVEVTVPIEGRDIDTFKQLTEFYCTFITPQPIAVGWEYTPMSVSYSGTNWKIYEISRDLVDAHKASHWVNLPRSGNSILLVGNVPYSVNIPTKVINPNLYQERGHAYKLFVYDCAIEDVSVHISRESLNDTPENTQILSGRVQTLQTELASQVLDGIDSLSYKDLCKLYDASVYARLAMDHTSSLAWPHLAAESLGITEDEFKKFNKSTKARRVSYSSYNTSKTSTSVTGMYNWHAWGKGRIYYHTTNSPHQTRTAWLWENKVRDYLLTAYKPYDVYDDAASGRVVAMSKDRWTELANKTGAVDYTTVEKIKLERVGSSAPSQAGKITTYSYSSSEAKFVRVLLDSSDSKFTDERVIWLPFELVNDDIHNKSWASVTARTFGSLKNLIHHKTVFKITDPKWDLYSREIRFIKKTQLRHFPNLKVSSMKEVFDILGPVIGMGAFVRNWFDGIQFIRNFYYGRGSAFQRYLKLKYPNVPYSLREVRDLVPYNTIRDINFAIETLVVEAASPEVKATGFDVSTKWPKLPIKMEDSVEKTFSIIEDASVYSWLFSSVDDNDDEKLDLIIDFIEFDKTRNATKTV